MQIARLRSEFEDVRVFEANGYRCIGFGEPPSVQTCVHKQDHLDFQFDYLSMMVAAATLGNEKPHRALILGLGGGALARLLRVVYPSIEIDAVEIDPAVVQAAERYLYYRPHPRTKVIIADAVAYASQAVKGAREYDLIFVDCYDSESIPASLRGLEFLRDLRHILGEGGLVIANLWEEHPSAREMKDSYEAVFAGRWLIPGTATSGNEVLIARPVEDRGTVEELSARPGTSEPGRVGPHTKLNLASHLARLRRLE